MATPIAKTFTTPVARLLGDMYTPNTTDLEGNPLLFKSGPNKGQAGRQDFFFYIGIPKGVERHWAETEWGAQIWAVGHAAKANAGQSQFSWKVKDGDDATPDDKGRRPCDRAGWAKHWIVGVSTGYPTKIFKMRPGSNPPAFDPFNDPGAVKPGYYVQVQITCDSNQSTAQPGVFLNHNMVCFSGFGEEISLGGADPTQAGFGAAPLPAGATLTPPANFNPAGTPPAPAAYTPPPAPLIPGLPPAAPAAYAPPPAPPVAPAPVAVNPTLQPVPGAAHTIQALRDAGWTDDQIVAGGHATRIAAVPAPLPPGGSAPTPPAPAPAAPVPVTPNPAFLAVPAPAAPPARVMLPAANGVPYESYIANKWTDAMLVQNGLMAA